MPLPTSNQASGARSRMWERRDFNHVWFIFHTQLWPPKQMGFLHAHPLTLGFLLLQKWGSEQGNKAAAAAAATAAIHSPQLMFWWSGATVSEWVRCQVCEEGRSVLCSVGVCVCWRRSYLRTPRWLPQVAQAPCLLVGKAGRLGLGGPPDTECHPWWKVSVQLLPWLTYPVRGGVWGQ